ncbi:hypothetical protein SAMN04488067_11514 [Halorubrum xinjiangense]|uniref:Uncharacterized protein n=1 Tax=Halorubrum xinjiangense TaxID=261291 RepID=A0A1G7RDZ8_9EURY|nr:hypothetical protein [Halorubrum xinjiangense]SDG09007.1 hypothetical protein SAMN04488067_11514 [Halorubrum xinjiangense]
MKIRYNADVESVVVDIKENQFQIGDWEGYFTFRESDHENLEVTVEGVVIVRKLSEEEKRKLIQRTKVEPAKSDGENSKLKIGTPEEVTNDARETLQAIESFGGLHGIHEVEWRFPEVEYIPESDSEKEDLDILNHHIEEEYPLIPKEWTFDLNKINWGNVKSLSVPLSFFRRGKRLFDEGDYINSYTNCYMVIEGLYAESHKNVESQFLDSKELLDAAKTSFEAVMETVGEELLEFFEFYDKEKSPEGYIRLLVVIRHQLNHFFGESNGPHAPNPLEADRFQPLSRAMMHLSYYVLLLKVYEIE